MNLFSNFKIFLIVLIGLFLENFSANSDFIKGLVFGFVHVYSLRVIYVVLFFVLNMIN